MYFFDIFLFVGLVAACSMYDRKIKKLEKKIKHIEKFLTETFNDEDEEDEEDEEFYN